MVARATERSGSLLSAAAMVTIPAPPNAKMTTTVAVKIAVKPFGAKPPCAVRSEKSTVGGYEDALHPATSFFGVRSGPRAHSATSASAWERPLSSTTSRTLWASRTMASRTCPAKSVR